MANAAGNASAATGRRKPKRRDKSMARMMVGHVVPTAAEVQKMSTALDDLFQQTSVYGVMLPTGRRQASLKWRRGSEGLVQKVANLVARYRVTAPNMSAADMLADLTLVERVAPLGDRAGRLTQLLRDTVLQAQSECWWAATSYYTVLGAMSASDGGLYSELEPIREFFAHGPRKAKPVEPVAAPSSVTAEPGATAAAKSRPRKPKSMMQNLVGHTLPSPTEVQKGADKLDALVAQCGKFGVFLTKEQRKSALKPRSDSGPIVDKIAALATRYGASVPSVSPADMLADKTLAERIGTLADRAAQLAQLVDDAAFQAHTECWWALTTWYAILDSMSAGDATLRAHLEEVRAAFATGSRARKAA